MRVEGRRERKHVRHRPPAGESSASVITTKATSRIEQRSAAIGSRLTSSRGLQKNPFVITNNLRPAIARRAFGRPIAILLIP